MAKFKFRLATLLRLREAARDERREELAEVHRVDGVLRERIDHVEEELGWLEGTCRKLAAPGTVNVHRLIDAERYERVLRSRHDQLGEQRDAVGAEIQHRRQKLLGVDRDVRILEKLRDKHAAGHRDQESRQELKQFDEVAQRRTAREDEP